MARGWGASARRGGNAASERAGVPGGAGGGEAAGVGESGGEGDTVDFAAVGVQRLPPLRRRRNWLRRRWFWNRTVVLTALLIAVLGGMGAGVWVSHQHALDQDPLVSAKRVAEPLAKGDAGGLAKQISGGNEAQRRAAAQRIVGFFKGWAIDTNTVRIRGTADDNARRFSFIARRPTGTRAFIHGGLWPVGETGDPPWKLDAIWIDHGDRHAAVMIWPPETAAQKARSKRRVERLAKRRAARRARRAAAAKAAEER